MNKQSVLRRKHCLKLEKVAGSATYKQSKTVCQFIQSWKQRQFVYLVCLDIKTVFKEALCRFAEEIQTQNFNINNINEIIIQTQQCLFGPWVNKQAALRRKHSLKLEKVAGSATYKHKVKQCETVLSKVSSFTESENVNSLFI